MNLFYSKTTLMRIGALMAAAAGVFTMSAENKLYPEDLVITDYEPTQLNIMLDLDEEVNTLQFKVNLPDGLVFPELEEGEAAYVKNDARFPKGLKPSFKPESGMFVVQSDGPAIAGESGLLVSILIQAEEGTLDGSAKTIKLTKIELTQGFGNDAKIVEAPTTASCQAQMNPGVYSFTFDSSEINVVAGRTFEVALGLSNSTPVVSTEFHVVLPEGFEIDEESINATERTKIDYVNYKNHGLINNFVILNSDDENAVLEAGEGAILTFNVTVPEDFEGKTAELIVQDGSVTVGNDLTTVDMPSVVLTLVDNTAETLRQEKNEAAYREVQEQIQTLTEALAAAEAEIDENYDGYMDEAEHEAIATSINALYAEAQAAYDAVEEEGEFDYTLDEDAVAAIKDAIDLLVENAKKAQEVSEASYLAHEADMEQYTEAYSEFIAALGEIEENWPDYDPTEMEEKISALFTALFNDLNAAYEAALENGEAYAFEGLDERIAEINAEIAEMKAAAEATGVAGIEAEGNGAVCYGIDGRVIANPAAGQMVIIVREGKATKHIVK